MSLDFECYQATCDEGHHCLRGECVDVPRRGIFDDLSLRDEGIPSDSAAEIVDDKAN